jgi:hypothetical protein
MPEVGKSHCRHCLDKLKVMRDAHKAKGLCGWGSGLCHEPAIEGHTMCKPHLEDLRIRSLNRQHERNKAKICVDCGERPQWWSRRCIICRLDYVKDPLPTGARKALKHYRRMEAIDSRRAQAEQAIQHINDERARVILMMRHGLIDAIDRTLEEIAANFKITRERVRQIESAELSSLEAKNIPVSLLRPPFVAVQRKPATKRRHLVSNEQRVKAAAHSLVAGAIASGELTQQPCEVCADPNTVAHHKDYSKPLDVNWLCRVHHMQAHRGRWIDKIHPETEPAKSIVAVLKTLDYSIPQLVKQTGISDGTIRAILTGTPNVQDDHVLALIKFCETHRSH